jgi:hypothetical protein
MTYLARNKAAWLRVSVSLAGDFVAERVKRRAVRTPADFVRDRYTLRRGSIVNR